VKPGKGEGFSREGDAGNNPDLIPVYPAYIMDTL
jgi:hypothetical protein